MTELPRWIARTSLSVALLALVGGCDGGNEGESDDEHAGTDTHTDETATDTHADETATDTHADETATDTEATGCAAETRDDEFAVGLTKSGALVTATFVSSDPAPPIKGDNTWVIDFTDGQAAPLADLSMVVIPMMPDHGHGTPIAVEVSATDTPGRYQFTPVNLFMAGYWEITFDITTGGGEQDSLMFGFCVE